MDEVVLYWSKEYAIGIEEIDSAHKEFFRILSKLVLLSRIPEKRIWVASEGLRFLRQYAVLHFATEERYMEEIEYPGLDRHRQRHQAFKARILPRIEGRLRKEGYSEKALEQFLKIMRCWLMRHIMGCDKAIGSHCMR